MTCPTSDWLTRILTTALGAAFLTSCAAATAQLGASAPPARVTARKSVWKGVYTEKQAARGQKTYEDECAQCHPVGKAGDEAAPVLVGPAFAARWIEQSVGDIFVATRTTMPQAAPNSLSKEAYADIVAYLLSANKYPAGDTELAPDPKVLEQIMIDRKPPQ